MALLIQDADIPRLAPMGEVVEAMETTLADHSRGAAPIYPRRVNLSARMEGGSSRYSMGAQVGIVPRFKIAGIRLNSGRTNRVRGEPRGPRSVGYQNRDWGIVVLFITETGELLSIFPQSAISPIRVGATTGVAVKHLARHDAEVVGVFGTSRIARCDLEAAAQVRRFKQAKVFSPNPDHRAVFARDMSEKLGFEVVAAADPREVVHNSDVILCSTNSNDPVFDGRWLTPGQLVTSAKSTPRPRAPLTRSFSKAYPAQEVIYRTEIDRFTLSLADRICVLNQEMMLNENQRELLDPLEDGTLSWEKVCELGPVILGESPGRQQPGDLIFYASTGGLGIQMAAAGSVIYRNAVASGLGMEIPSDWFSADLTPWHEQGFFPSP